MNKIQTIARVAFSVIVSFACIAVVLAGCGSQQATYTPAAYGVPGHCYYVNDRAEAIALEAAGLCPSSWAPTVMPLAWHEQYDVYYDSPAYYDTYVPARARTTYVHQQTTFASTYKTAIITRSKTATYKSSAGGTVKGSKLSTSTSKVKFGSGTSFGQSGTKNGSGSLRGGSKSGTSKSSIRSGSTSRSGSLRSGSSGSRSGFSSSRSGGLRSGSIGHR